MKSSTSVFNEISIVPLRVDETLVIISATIVMQGKSLNTKNIFFQTFKKVSSARWELIRSYIEAGIPIENIDKMQLNYYEN
ncbi:hypothetical protein BGM25_24235 [Bacillus sp. FJAT-29953]|nr:hypothetical protein [Bacillus sp. FJAT-29953]